MFYHMDILVLLCIRSLAHRASVPAAASRPAPSVAVAPAKPAPKSEPKKAKKAAPVKAQEDDLETFLALPTLILFWVVMYAVLNEEEED